jgi:hypothetical protein
VITSAAVLDKLFRLLLKLPFQERRYLDILLPLMKLFCLLDVLFVHFPESADT